MTQLEWLAEDVLCAVRGQSLHTQDWVAHGVSIDSRTTKTGDIFVAIKGPSLDGHDYVRAAFDAGAVVAIVDHQPPNVPSDAPLLFVEDAFSALQDLGRRGRARACAHVAAVTGSVGKTSSKEQLRLMLGSVDDTYANEGSLNNLWGVPLSLARLPAQARYGVFEIGMNHAGELAPLSREVQPHVALITNVEAVHLEFFASTEAIADAKAEIFLGMDPQGIAILNRDNAHFARLLAAARTQGLKKTLSFGRDPKSDAHLIAMTPDETGTDVEAEILGDKISYRVGAPGAHLAFNTLGTLLTCVALGADIMACADALAAYRLPEGRGTRRAIKLATGGSFTLIDETFNASPVATHAALDVLGTIKIPQGARRIVALGDMRELGETGPALHAGLADTLVKNKIDLVHCCGALMAHLHDALPTDRRGALKTNSTDLAPCVAANIKDGDVVMVKGSKSMKMGAIIKALESLADTQQKRAS